MINVLAHWKRIFSKIFGSKEYQSALEDTEDTSVISRKHVPILICYPTTNASPRECRCARGVRTDKYDEDHYVVEVWYGKDKKDYEYFSERERFDRLIMIPPVTHGLKSVMKYNHLVMMDRKTHWWGSEVTYIARPLQEETREIKG